MENRVLTITANENGTFSLVSGNIETTAPDIAAAQASASSWIANFPPPAPAAEGK